MRRTDAIAWVVCVCAASLRLSQAKTLSVLVAATLNVQRVSLANIGRRMLGSTKHQIKRCWRFCANRRSLAGSAIGSMTETQEMLDFCGKHQITSDIELTSIQKVNEAYERVLKSDVRYRFVIDMASLKNA
jgi:D-arabinose 1-dehydrogenase-like Zn-dependent alcohol dehydrogenase